MSGKVKEKIHSFVCLIFFYLAKKQFSGTNKKLYTLITPKN